MKMFTTAVLVATCVIYSGCGSSTPEKARTAAVPAYVATANAICTKQLAHLASMPEPTTPEQSVSYLPVALSSMRGVASRLSTLHTRPPVTAELAAGLASSRKLAAVLSSFLHDLREGIVELSTFTTVETQSETLRKQIDEHFRRAGLVKCLQ
jgi:hypothetical protein